MHEKLCGRRKYKNDSVIVTFKGAGNIIEGTNVCK